MAYTWRPAEHPWWPWVLVAVGLYLAGSFGSALRGLSPAQILAPLSPTEARLAPEALRNPDGLELRARVTHRLEGVALGVAATILGLGALARRKLVPGDARRGLVLGAVLGLWALGEAFALAAFRVLLVIACFTVVAALVQGAPPSGDVVNAAIDRTLDAAVVAIDVTLGSLRLSA